MPGKDLKAQFCSDMIRWNLSPEEAPFNYGRTVDFFSLPYHDKSSYIRKTFFQILNEFIIKLNTLTIFNQSQTVIEYTHTVISSN